jgi:hypothetical protein
MTRRKTNGPDLFMTQIARAQTVDILAHTQSERDLLPVDRALEMAFLRGVEWARQSMQVKQ